MRRIRKAIQRCLQRLRCVRQGKEEDEEQRLNDIARWMQAEQLELCFWSGYWAARDGQAPSEAWRESGVKQIVDARRKKLVKPVSLEV